MFREQAKVHTHAIREWRRMLCGAIQDSSKDLFDRAMQLAQQDEEPNAGESRPQRSRALFLFGLLYIAPAIPTIKAAEHDEALLQARVSLEQTRDTLLIVSHQSGRQTVLPPHWPTLSGRAKALYSGLESRRVPESKYRALTEDLSKQILSPLEVLVDSCEEVVFELPWDLLDLPIDILLHREQPLFLQNQSPIVWLASSNVH